MQLLGRQRRILSPLSLSPLLLRVSIKKKKKKSVSPHDSQFIQANVNSPTLQSSSGLCVPRIQNEQQLTVGEVSQPPKVMAQASRLAGPDNAVPSLQGSDSWLSKKKQQKSGSGACSCTSWCRLHFRCCRNTLDLVVNLKTCLDHCWARHAPLTLFDCVTCAIYSRSLYATSQRHDL